MIDARYTVVPSSTIEVPRTLARIFLPYVFITAACWSLFFIACSLEFSVATMALGSFGVVSGIGSLFAAYYEYVHTERQWELYYRQQTAAIPQPPPQPIQILQQFAGPDGTQKLLRTDLPDRPDTDFIDWVFEYARQSGGMAPTEEKAKGHFEGRASSVQTNLWLTLLEQAKVIEKTGDYVNAPRRVCAGMTAEVARKRFGYEEG